MARKPVSYLAGAALLGTAIGAVVGVLTAPKSGPELRRALKEQAERTLERANEAGRQAGKQAQEATRALPERLKGLPARFTRRPGPGTRVTVEGDHAADGRDQEEGG